MKRYEAYKDSGIDWIGEIPEGWEMLSNKYIFNLKKNQVGKKSAEYELLSLTLRGIIKRDMENPEGKFPAEFDTYQEIKKGDFVFCLFDVEETPRTVGLSDFDGMITGAYTVFDTKPTADKKFLYYFYLNLDEKKRLKFLYRGLRNTIPKDSFFSFKTIFPPLSEQTVIAEFLDDKTAKIDQLIGIKQKEIELLKERRQILIQQAVTKGLDATVPMKDSGVDWIGEIPEHWEVTPGRTIFKERKESNKGLKNSIVLSLSYGKIIIKPEEKMYGLVPESFETYQLVYEGDIIVRGTDLQNDKTSLRTGLSHYNGIITSAYLNLIVKNSSAPSFIQLFLYVMDISKEIYKYGSGLRQNLSFNDFKLMPILDVPLDEQIQIVSYLEEIEEKIAKAILLKQQEIEKLKEYKTVLIDQVVTGKVKVMGNV